MIERRQGDVLDADAEAIVNTVNCVGVMGKGVALRVKQAYPQVYARYRKACQAGEVQPGRMLVVPTNRLDNPKYIINFPTKRHWRQAARLADIRAGLPALIAEVKRLGLRSVAVPALGCGNGGLDWDTVRPLIEEAFAALPEVRVLLYDPWDAAAHPPRQPGPERLERDGRARRQSTNTAQPSSVPCTAAAASLIYLMARYGELGYELSWREVARLAILLRAAGELLPVADAAGWHPRPPDIHRLRSMLSQWIEGEPDGRCLPAALRLRPGAAAVARRALNERPEVWARARRVARLIEGFASPYGLELLVTVHHLGRELPDAATDAERAVTETIARFGHERRYLQPNHVRKAWQRLHEHGWLPHTAPALPAR